MKEETKMNNKKSPCNNGNSRVCMLLGQLFFVLVVLLLSLQNTLTAKTMKDIWMAMPDSMIHYLNAKQRADMINIEDIGLTNGTENALDGKSYIERITDSYLSVKLTNSSMLQIRRLPMEGDSVLCVAKTYLEPQKETIVALYDQKTWKKIRDLSFNAEDLILRPDTMTVDDFSKLKEQIDPCFVSAVLPPDLDDEIVVSALTPNASADSVKVNALMVSKKYKWTGHNFE